jgi:hypothetical protein
MTMSQFDGMDKIRLCALHRHKGALTAQRWGAEASTLLPFRCPKTSRLMKTAIETNCASLAKAWFVTMKIVCAYICALEAPPAKRPGFSERQQDVLG